MKVKIKGLDFTIRASTNQDYRYCYLLLKKNMLNYFEKYWGGWNPKIFRRDFNVKNTKIILNKDKRVGYYVLRTEDKFTYLSDIQISLLFRGKGIGTKIMEIIEEETLKMNKNRIQLTVFKDNPAKKLYERMGYKIVKDKQTSVLMEKRLK